MRKLIKERMENNVVNFVGNLKLMLISVLLCSNLESMSNLKLMLKTFIIDLLSSKTNNNTIIMTI